MTSAVLRLSLSALGARVRGGLAAPQRAGGRAVLTAGAAAPRTRPERTEAPSPAADFIPLFPSLALPQAPYGTRWPKQAWMPPW